MTVGFLLLQEIANTEVFVGAILITDEFGVPLEFKCTHAIKPTAIQKALYGEKLRPFIAINLCGIPLYKSLQNEPELIFVKQSFCLNLHTEVDASIVLVNKAGETLTAQDEGQRDRIQSEGDYQPIVVSYHPDSKVNENQEIREIVSDVFGNFDVLEPFDRITKSIEILGRNDPKFK